MDANHLLLGMTSVPALLQGSDMLHCDIIRVCNRVMKAIELPQAELM